MDVIREVQACDFGGCYVIYVNILKMEVIYVIFFSEVMCGNVYYGIEMTNARSTAKQENWE